LYQSTQSIDMPNQDKFNMISSRQLVNVVVVDLDWLIKKTCILFSVPVPSNMTPMRGIVARIY
jgi:hypothetical protein